MKINAVLKSARKVPKSVILRCALRSLVKIKLHFISLFLLFTMCENLNENQMIELYFTFFAHPVQ